MGRCPERLIGSGSGSGGTGPLSTGSSCCHCERSSTIGVADGVDMAEDGSDGVAVAEGTRPEEAVERVRTALIDLVGDVLVERRAYPAYAVFTRIEAVAEQSYRRDDVYESFLGTALVLAAVADRAATAGGHATAEVVAWVRDNLGAWAATAAARAGAAVQLPSSSAAVDPVLRDVQDDLREHVLPALVWLTAGVVAVAGAGDPGWLRRISDSS